MKSKTIEVNGKQYDAITGKLVVHTAVASRPHRGQNIDGFFRGRTSAPVPKVPPISDSISVLAAPAPAPKPHKQPNRNVNHTRRRTPETSKRVAIRVKSDTQHSQKLTVHRTPANPNHVKAVKTQSSQTLMRTAVKRPGPSFHNQARPQAALQHNVPSLLVTKKAAAALDAARLVRAQQASRSPLVTHHASTPAIGVVPQFGPLAVKPMPVKPNEQVPPVSPPPQQGNAPAPTGKPSPTDIFEHALANANHFVDLQAHKVHYRKKARRHVASMAAGTLALLFISAFAFYQNSPGLQFKVASYHAGVATHMPNFKAAGFAYDGAKANYGKLVLGFSDAHGTYRLSQQATNLESKDVVSSLGSTDASGNPDYTTVQAGNTTVYRFSNTDATWVQNGTWYVVNGNSSLSDSQVQSLVRNI